MDRRRYLLSTVAITGLSGCSGIQGPLNIWPEPEVVDHVRGDPVVADIGRTAVLNSPDRYWVSVTNTGIPADVEVTLYWVPREGQEPGTLSRQELTDAGFEIEDQTTTQLDAGDTQAVEFRGRQPRDAAGFFIRPRTLTYGATITNSGGDGDVTAELVDTSDLSDTELLSEKTVTVQASARRTVTFRVEQPFESFRVDVSASGL